MLSRVRFTQAAPLISPHLGAYFLFCCYRVEHIVQVSLEVQHVWHDLPPLEVNPFDLLPYVQAQASVDPGKYPIEQESLAHFLYVEL